MYQQGILNLVSAHFYTILHFKFLIYLYTHHSEFYIILSVNFAAEPSAIEVDSSIHVHLPYVESTVPTQLHCGREPGVLVQRYSVKWFRQFQNRRFVYDGEDQFELILNVNSTLNESKHLCMVTVNHDGTLNETYPGGIITIQITGYLHTP